MTNTPKQDGQTIDEILETLGETYYPLHEYSASYADDNEKSIFTAKQAIADWVRSRTGGLMKSVGNKTTDEERVYITGYNTGVGHAYQALLADLEAND